LCLNNCIKLINYLQRMFVLLLVGQTKSSDLDRRDAPGYGLEKCCMASELMQLANLCLNNCITV
jgi:hypothetical protein